MGLQKDNCSIVCLSYPSLDRKPPIPWHILWKVKTLPIQSLLCFSWGLMKMLQNPVGCCGVLSHPQHDWCDLMLSADDQLQGYLLHFTWMLDKIVNRFANLQLKVPSGRQPLRSCWSALDFLKGDCKGCLFNCKTEWQYRKVHDMIIWRHIAWHHMTAHDITWLPETWQTGSLTNRRMDGQTLPSTLSPSFAVDNEVYSVLGGSKCSQKLLN